MNMKTIEELKAKQSAIKAMCDSPYINRELKSLITYYYCLEAFDDKDDTSAMKAGIKERLEFMIEKLEWKP